MRKIIHADMDAFFASVEQRDNPALKGKPVIVGGHPGSRGVVAAASYEARRYGVHAAMPLSQARRLCPQAIFVPTRMDVYRQVSGQVAEILSSFTPLVEQVALDESFLDVTESERLFGTALEMAKKIKAEIKARLNLTASAGVAPNKFLAKIASGLGKPDGLVAVDPHRVAEFLKDLPVSKIWGVGKVTETELKRMGIRTIGQLASRPLGELIAKFGKGGERLYYLARGQDDSPVEPEGAAKSLGQEETFEQDVSDINYIRRVILGQCEEVARRARAEGLKGKTVVLKLRYSDFSTRTRQGTLLSPTDSTQEIYQEVLFQLGRFDLEGKKIRLVGVALAGLVSTEQEEQLSLFPVGYVKWRRAEGTLDQIRERFGPGTVQRASASTGPEDSSFEASEKEKDA